MEALFGMQQADFLVEFEIKWNIWRKMLQVKYLSCEWVKHMSTYILIYYYELIYEVEKCLPSYNTFKEAIITLFEKWNVHSFPWQRPLLYLARINLVCEVFHLNCTHYNSVSNRNALPLRNSAWYDIVYFKGCDKTKQRLYLPMGLKGRIFV